MENTNPNPSQPQGIPPQGQPQGLPPQGMPPQGPPQGYQQPPQGYQQPPQGYQQPPQGYQQPGQSEPQFQMPTGQFTTNTMDSTGQFDPNDIQQNKFMAILAYFGILVLVPIFAAKNSAFARFHANQGLILLIVDVIFVAFNNIVGLLLLRSSIGLGAYTAFSVLMSLFGIAIFVLFIMGIINAAKGTAKTLPLIGGFQILK